jgi:hypothetical protein
MTDYLTWLWDNIGKVYVKSAKFTRGNLVFWQLFQKNIRNPEEIDASSVAKHRKWRYNRSNYNLQPKKC